MNRSSVRSQFRRLMSDLRDGRFDKVRQTAHPPLAQALTDEVLQPLQMMLAVTTPRSMRERTGGRVECLLRAGSDCMQLSVRFSCGIVGLAVSPTVKLSRGRHFFEQRLQDLDTHQLLGVLCLPRRRPRNMPIVVLLSGSGPQNADYTVGPNHIFRELAARLARQGIGTVRFDKRMTASAAVTDTTEQEYVQPAMAILRVLGLQAPDSPCFLLGHSLGGYVAPLIAWRQSQANAPLAGVAILAAPWRCLETLIREQAEHLLPTLASCDAEQLQADLEHLQAVVTEEAETGQLAFGMSSGYLHALREQHPASWLKANTQTPLLLLQGLADRQVSSVSDFPLWISATMHHPGSQWRTYPGLDHLFRRSKLGIPTLDYTHRRPMAGAVIRDLIRWLHTPLVDLQAKLTSH